MSRKKTQRRQEFLRRTQLSGTKPILKSDPSKRSRLRDTKYGTRVGVTRATREFKCPFCPEEMPGSARVQHLVGFHGYVEPGRWSGDPAADR